ncbi:phage baseplate protein [Bombella pollinis]|uniref:Dit-like phage tail protein N-terminal domain-containing protein n=1 Tax=Bombella pollinis TaxID=2967337 RepID=A0ABT3WK50_9PROT|nr:hypothetical protein [Bombella pollinis]MCX5619465.1 hypothetical protein [Bombella pollinis]
MSALTSLRATASSFGGDALENWAIQRAARQWGIFTNPKTEAKKGWQTTATKLLGNDVTTLFGKGPKRVLSAAHVSSLKIEEKSSICTAPQENTSFTSYNKVAAPYTATIRMICDGSETGNLAENLLPGFLRGALGVGPDAVKSDFTKTLVNLVKDTNLYVVITPEHNYRNANITGYSFTRASDGTADYIVADITLQEVRQSATSLWPESQKPQGSPTQNMGTTTLNPGGG